MKSKGFRSKPAPEAIRDYLAAKDQAIRCKAQGIADRFVKYCKAQQTTKGNRWPFDFTPQAAEIEKLIDYLFLLRQSPASFWMRRPWIPDRDGALCPSQLPTSSDDEPRNHGEEFASLLRKYWQLAFGFKIGRTDVQGIALVIFAASAIDNLSVGLLVHDLSKSSLREIGQQLRHNVDQNSRTHTPTPKKRAETVRQKIRDLQKPRLK